MGAPAGAQRAGGPGMTDRPILFSAPMVRALLSGIKTQTRRTLPPHIVRYGEFDGPGLYHPTVIRKGEEAPGPETYGIWARDGAWASKLPIRPCDRLWVREAWRAGKGYDAYPPREMSHWPVHYEADGKPEADDDMGMNGRMRASMHMPRWASRLTLTVTDLRVQRLQEISEADAISEGVSPLASGRYHCGFDEDGEITCKSPITAYAWLWNRINGDDAWGTNPWVVAYSFTVDRRNIDARAAG